MLHVWGVETGDATGGGEAADEGLSPKSSVSGIPGRTGPGGSPTPQRGIFRRVEILTITDGPQLIEPSEVVVSHGPASILTAAPILTPLGIWCFRFFAFSSSLLCRSPRLCFLVRMPFTPCTETHRVPFHVLSAVICSITSCTLELSLVKHPFCCMSISSTISRD